MTRDEESTYVRLLEEGRIAEAEDYLHRLVPRILTKFVALGDDEQENEKRFLSLKNNWIWFSTASQYNDPAELASLYFDREDLRSHGVPEELASAYCHFFAAHIKKFLLVSLSANTPDNLPMWAYYTNNHHGFCIEYEVLDTRQICKLIYVPKRYNITNIFTETLQSVAAHEKYGAEFPTDHMKKMIIMKNRLYMKSASWQHENECRIIYLEEEEKAGANIPLDSVGLKIRRIIAGVNCSDKHMARLQSISNSLGCGKITLAKVNECSENFIDFED